MQSCEWRFWKSQSSCSKRDIDAVPTVGSKRMQSNPSEGMRDDLEVRDAHADLEDHSEDDNEDDSEDDDVDDNVDDTVRDVDAY